MTSRSARPTGPTTRLGSVGTATPSTRPPPGRTSRWTPCSSTACSTRRICCTDSPSPGATISTATGPDVGVWEVFDADGVGLGLFVGDYFTRDGKRGGAWSESLVAQSHLLGERPVVANNMNIPAPPPGSPALLTTDEVGTMFHEFGHALHALLSDVTYPRLSGTAVARDFVEFPSQVNEMWLSRPAVLGHYARRVDDGSPMPAELAAALGNPPTFNQGFETVASVAATWIDLAWHRLTYEQAQAVTDVTAFEAEALAAGRAGHRHHPAELPGTVLQPHLRRRVLGRLLLLPVERGARRRHGRVVRRARRPSPRGRRAVPAGAAESRWKRPRDGDVRGLPRPSTSDRATARPPGTAWTDALIPVVRAPSELQAALRFARQRADGPEPCQHALVFAPHRPDVRRFGPVLRPSSHRIAQMWPVRAGTGARLRTASPRCAVDRVGHLVSAPERACGDCRTRAGAVRNRSPRTRPVIFGD